MASQPEKPARDLTSDELGELRSNGVTCVRQILSDEWLSRIAAGIEREFAIPNAISDLVSMKDQGFLSDLFMWLHDADFRALVFESPLAHLAQQAIGSTSVTHFYDQLFVKDAGADVPTPWHHDLTYWPVSGQQIVSMWISLDPVTRDSSGLEYVKGSHLWPKRFKAITADHNEYMVNPELEDAPDISADRDAYELVDWDIEPGDVLMFHPLIVHGSAGNSSTTMRRRALASRWTGEDVVYAPQPYTMPLPKGHGLEAGDPLSGPIFPKVL
jgi:ectoine hydroxylase-related dioxygenase (phytanoyl-CoA dioxygenase family)